MTNLIDSECHLKRLVLQGKKFFCEVDLAWKIFLMGPISLGRFFDVLKVGYLFLLFFIVPCASRLEMTELISQVILKGGISDGRSFDIFYY